MRKVWVYGGVGVGVLAAVGLAAAGWWLFAAAPDSFTDRGSPNEVVVKPPTDVSKSATDAAREIQIAVGTKVRDGFPESLTIRAGTEQFELQCTGKFVRTRVLLIVPIDLYALASYIPNPVVGDGTQLLADMLVDGQPKVYLLRFLKSLSGSQILKAIQDEIDATFTDVDMDKHGAEIKRFVQKFAKGSNKGDVVYMAWLPGSRIYCSFGDANRMELISTDSTVARAIWRIWCGEAAGPERVGLVERFASKATVGK